MSDTVSHWFVYIIRCHDNSLYTGITTDVERRFQQHVSGKGAKYFYGRRPQKVVLQETLASKSEALKREIEIKKLSKQEKERLILSHCDEA